MPSENELAEYFGVSRNTVMRAYALLRSVGVVKTRRGKGHFMNDAPEFRECHVPPGTMVHSRRPVSGEDRKALDAAGAALFTPVLVIERPGKPPEIHDAASCRIVFEG